MRKVYLLFATAAMLAASCANDDFSGDNSSQQTGTGAIAFNMNMPSMSRAENNASAAKDLNYEFIVWGDKTSNSAVSTVFENYRVQYKDNDGNSKTSTTSNTTGWEYAGIKPYTSTQVSPAITQTSQTIKYWDSQATNYIFTAVSALNKDITDGKVAITRTPADNATTSATTGYTITLKNGADATKIFVADKNTVTPTNYTSAENVQAVKMAFRNFQTKIRFGFFETVPGYKVQITGVKYGSNESSVATNFGVDGQFVQVPTGTGDADKLTYTVTYDSNGKPVLSMTTTSSALKTSESFGSAIFNVDLGENAKAAKYDKTESETNGAYTLILPNTENETPMSFTVDYKLISEDTGEQIAVTGRKVTVPAQYCQWKPNYAYTYLFKITDKSADLYPITFDAVVVADVTGNQETITEVGEPSITTYVKGKQVTTADEYAANDVIYAYAQDGTSTAPMSSSNMKLYKVTLAEGVTGYEITEAAVDHALKNSSVTSKKLNVEEITSSSEGSDKPSYEAIPREDSGNRTITGMKWTASAGTTYAVEYIKGSGDDQKKYYKIVKVASGN